MRCGNTVRRIFAGGITCWTVAAVFGLVVCSAAEPDTGGLDVVKVRPNFYMIAGAGGNIGVQIGSEGGVLGDRGTAASSTDVLAAIKNLPGLPIRYIINADAGPDFVGGNLAIAKAGLAVMNGHAGAEILAHESVLDKMS